MPDNLTPPRFRVPREDRSLLFIPELSSTSRLVEDNRTLFAESVCSLNGRSLADLRASARKEAVSEARDYTSSLLRSDVPEFATDSVVVSGHQPELFHVGVWAKNLTLAGIARRCQSVAINLVIDNDTLNSTAMRIPAGTRERLRIERVLFDTPRPTLPWEEAKILDPKLFHQFGTNVQEQIRAVWGFAPLLGTAWDSETTSSTQPKRLCDELTAMRARVERQWGMTNLELPMSRLCETESFHWFASHLLMRLPELHRIYNESVAEYRLEHRLRNRMQPVPDLDRVEDWFEAPFWIWRRGDSQRGRLFARIVDSVCELRDQNEVFARLTFTEQGPLDAAVAALGELRSRGIRLRTRALTTTLFARTCLADLFVHGIGGAKYDAMTDRICEQLFGIKAPSFLTVSATLYLPLGGPFAATENQLHERQHALRDLTYNPDRHIARTSDSELSALIAEKNALLESASALRESKQLRGRLTREQHHRLVAIRSLLQTHTDSVRVEYESSIATLRSQLAANSLVRNREYSWVLYPEHLLQEFLTPLSNLTN